MYRWYRTCKLCTGSQVLRSATAAKHVTMKGKQLHVSYANKNLSSKYVGIQINKVNMIPYYDYLVKQGPKDQTVLISKSSGKLILKNGDDTLTAYVGKRTYYLRG